MNGDVDPREGRLAEPEEKSTGFELHHIFDDAVMEGCRQLRDDSGEDQMIQRTPPILPR